MLLFTASPIILILTPLCKNLTEDKECIHFFLPCALPYQARQSLNSPPNFQPSTVATLKVEHLSEILIPEAQLTPTCTCAYHRLESMLIPIQKPKNSPTLAQVSLYLRPIYRDHDGRRCGFSDEHKHCVNLSNRPILASGACHTRTEPYPRHPAEL